MMNWIWFLLAAVLEIAGCYAFWAWLRLHQSPLWLVPGVVSLVLFALMLTRVDTLFAGRAFAAYGGVYIVASLAWMTAVERGSPLLLDFVGLGLCLAGAAVILLAPAAA